VPDLISTMVRAGPGLAGRLLGGAAGLFDPPAPADLADRDPDLIRDLLPGLWLAASVYFRAEVTGLENLPPTGPLLCVGNHSGGVVLPDTLIFTLAFNAYFGVERPFHPVAHDRWFSTPGLRWIRRLGILPASPANAKLALDAGAAVLVYPGGDWEAFRPSWRSGRIDFAGRTGFIRTALRHGVPIAPVVSLGGQETALFLSQGGRLARSLRLAERLRFSVLPVTVSVPWGLQVGAFAPYLPLPAKIRIRVLEPFDVRQRFGPDPDVDEVYRVITADMQSALDGMVTRRALPVVG
jgi:1-acyl-sn-glycerol-3-phosphate acyltransferase